jgi:hypothetical protein
VRAGHVPDTLDHLVYATPDLDLTVADLEGVLGVRAAFGGVHPGRGSRNALIALGPRAYLEILGPDPAQPPSPTPRWFQLSGPTSPKLVTWAIHATPLAAIAERAWQESVRLGPVMSGARQRPDGVSLKWMYTDPATVVAGGLVPFLIDWLDSPHPSTAAPTGPPLIGLRAEHPDPDEVRRMLQVLGAEIPVEHGAGPRLIATFRTRNGDIDLDGGSG